MAITPRRGRSASASQSPTKSNGRKKPIHIGLSDDDDSEVEEKEKPAKRGRPAKAKQPIEVVDDDDDDDDDDDSVQAEDEYVVEAIRKHENLKGSESWGFQYLIKWKDYPEEENTWEPEGNIPDNIIDAYWKTQPAKSQPKKFAQESKRKSRYDDGVEEVEDSESEEEAASTSKHKAGNGRKSAASSTKPSSAKRARLSTSSRRRSSTPEDEEEEEEEEDGETSTVREQDKVRALEKVRVRFLDHYMKREDWHDCVDGIINMQRSEDDSQLQSFVQFEQSSSWTRAMDSIGAPEEADGKGPRIWVDNDVVNERCPQLVIKFYEQHVRFANPRAAR